MVVTRLLLAWNNQPIFVLEQPCFGVVIWLKFLYGYVIVSHHNLYVEFVVARATCGVCKGRLVEDVAWSFHLLWDLCVAAS